MRNLMKLTAVAAVTALWATSALAAPISVPEPMTLSLLGAGLAGIFIARRRG